jgi:hypothetical protein
MPPLEDAPIAVQAEMPQGTGPIQAAAEAPPTTDADKKRRRRKRREGAET